jgi:hypothetical protein
MTFILPGQADTIYDPFVVNYLLKIVGILEAPQMAKVKQIDLERDPYIAQPQFWDSSIRATLEYTRLC